nr:putative aminotransferase [uncultured bacterium]
MKYDFDRITERRGTDSVKWDLAGTLFKTEDLLPMWVADMDFEVPDFIREAISARNAHPILGYTFRPTRFYEALVSWLKRRHGWEVPPEAVSFSPGIVPALNLAVLGLTSPGDRIVVQPPVYFPFFSAVTNHGRELVYNQLIDHQGHYQIDFDHLEQQFRQGASMFFLCHPHNPVGRVWNRGELEQLAELCIRYKVLILSDEIHSDLLLFGHKHLPIASLGREVADITLTCVAPSKTFNLAGLHTSAVVITQPELKKKYDRSLDAVHVGGGNIFGQVAMEAAYTHGDEWLSQLISYLENNFRILEKEMGSCLPGVRISPLEATYLAWMDFSFLKMSDQELREFMVDRARVGMNDGPMFGPGGSGYQRLNIAAPAATLREGIRRIVDAINEIMPI